jgi:hypothetical protein
MINFKVLSYNDQTGKYSGQLGNVQKLLDSMSNYFSGLIVGNTTVQVKVNVLESRSGELATGGSLYSWDSTSNGLGIMGNTQKKIVTTTQTTAHDGSLNLTPTSMDWFASWLENPSSSNGLDVMTTVKHEVLHMLGFSGNLDRNTGLSKAGEYTSIFDTHVKVIDSKPYFDGFFTRTITGGMTPLHPLGSVSGVYHVDDESMGKDDLMGWTFFIGGMGQQDVSIYDLAILKDLGYTLKTTLSSGDGRHVIPGAGTKVSGTATTDTAYFAGKATNYSMSTAWDGTITVSSKIDGAVTTGMNSIERIKFSDTAKAYDADIGAGQVYRLYQAAFNRKPDLEGLGYWIKAIDAGYTITQIAESFVIQPQLTKLNNADFIESLYQNALHRPSDDGKSYWVGRLEDGMSRAAVLASFSDSAENKVKVILDINSTEAKAYRMYQAAFDRQPDLWGHIAWSDLLKQNKIDINGMAAGFVGSDEFKLKYGNNLTDKQFVTQLYANVLNREPEPAGQVFWESALANGVSRAHLLAQFSESPENRAQIVGVWQDGFEYIPYTA